MMGESGPSNETYFLRTSMVVPVKDAKRQTFLQLNLIF